MGVPPAWELCDLNSANGTYVNGQRLYGCHRLQAGDRILFGQPGQNCPEFVFEYQQTYQPTIPSPPAANPYYPPTVPVAPPVANPYSPPPPGSPPPLPVPPPPPPPGSPPPLPVPPPPPPPVYSAAGESQPSSLRFSQVFPIASTGRDLARKAFLIPGIFTVVFVVGMFFSLALSNRGHRFITFATLLGLYLALAAYYFIYRLCGKPKPWWLLTGSIVFTILSLLFVADFTLIPWNVGAANLFGEASFFNVLLANFVGPGLGEEFFKAIPVVLVLLLGTRLHSPSRERIGVWEPLDGILLGAASAVGFTLVETLLIYVPRQIEEAGIEAGLQLLIPRIIGSVSGHMAYSGYLGYFIGLSMLKPRKRWRILAIGYFSAATLHALWNSIASLGLFLGGLFSSSPAAGLLIGGFLLMLVGVVSYAFLAAAILKARALSPNRSQNFATRFFN
ncbi:MAG: PrsW family intramembrane metalloprotease [Cyanosarcina radialis HA8281-LM2]|nr:PrsW family intramembrane metalloprotease [Cyanosarcina radialis HA8281-LM2]